MSLALLLDVLARFPVCPAPTRSARFNKVGLLTSAYGYLNQALS